MKPLEIKEYLLKKPDIKVDNSKADMNEGELYWLRMVDSADKYIAGICISEGGTTSFVMSAPWLIDQTAESRLSYSIIEEIYHRLGLEEDARAQEACFITNDHPNKEELELGYKITKNYERIIRSESFKALAGQLEAIVKNG